MRRFGALSSIANNKNAMMLICIVVGLLYVPAFVFSGVSIWLVIFVMSLLFFLRAQIDHTVFKAQGETCQKSFENMMVKSFFCLNIYLVFFLSAPFILTFFALDFDLTPQNVLHEFDENTLITLTGFAVFGEHFDRFIAEMQSSVVINVVASSISASFLFFVIVFPVSCFTRFDLFKLRLFYYTWLKTADYKFLHEPLVLNGKVRIMGSFSMLGFCVIPNYYLFYYIRFSDVYDTTMVLVLANMWVVTNIFMHAFFAVDYDLRKDIQMKPGRGTEK